MTAFPSREHDDALCEKVKRRVELTEAETRDYHAYVYGWRRVVLCNDQRFSPVDPSGKHFNASRVGLAEGLFRQQYQPPRRRWKPPLHDDNPHFAAQWRELARLRARITRDWLPDGSPSPEAIAYVEAACRFAEVYLRHWGERNRQAMAAWSPVDQVDHPTDALQWEAAE